MMLSKCCSIAKIGTFSVTVLGVTLVLIGWTASTGIAHAEDMEVTDSQNVAEVVNPVRLVPEDIGDNLKVKPEFANKGDNQCKKNKHPGCLLFNRNTLVHIVFRLPGTKNKVKSCPEAEYVITEIKVTATAADDATNKSKGKFDVPVEGWLVENAFPSVNTSNGIIHEASWDVAQTQVLITNLNDHQNLIEDDDVTKSFWYKITVTACAENADGTHRTWVTDPRGDNEGKN